MFEVEKKPKNTYSRIRCANDIYDQIADIADECDLTLKQVTDALLGYALAHSQVISSEKTIVESKLIVGEIEND
ncbi:hypothetical protein [Streptococcus halotolerans]|uniref:hypothetical protein n=1 Tax=Streptococcus halotolerans TaxID=1814128 RepID=UPI000789AAA9|nr:hypothetical protein [Streptococcus halotolerans]